MSCGNYLTTIEFDVSIAKFKNLSLNVQKAILPGFTSTTPKQSSPLSKITRPYDFIDFNFFTLTCLIDADMSNYFTINSWMKQIGFPENSNQRKMNVGEDDRLHSDISVFLLDSVKKPIIQYRFKNAIPVTLGDIELNRAVSDVVYPTVDITFDYDVYELILPNR